MRLSIKIILSLVILCTGTFAQEIIPKSISSQQIKKIDQTSFRIKNAFEDPELKSAIGEILRHSFKEMKSKDLSLIRRLNIPNKKIRRLGGIESCVNLTHINLNNNVIQDLTPLHSNKKIKIVSILGNPSSSKLCGSVDKLIASGVKVISECHVSPGTIVKFPDKNLEKIIRENIGKRTGTITVMDLKKITEVNARWNEVVSFPEEKINDIRGLEYCFNMKRLLIPGNNVKSFGLLRNLTNLESLWLDNNQFKDLDGFEYLPSLKSLNINDNKIQDIEQIKNSKELTHLGLSRNKLDNDDLKILSSLPMLEALGFADSKISDVKILKKLKKLKELDLSNNDLDDEDLKVLMTLNNIERLTLNGNQINNIEPILGLTASQVKEISINNNPLTLNSCRIAVELEKIINIFSNCQKK